VVLAGLDGADKPVIDADGTGHADHLSVHVPLGGAALPGLLRELDNKGIELAAVEVRRPTLDDVFLSLTGRSLRDESATPA